MREQSTNANDSPNDQTGFCQLGLSAADLTAIAFSRGPFFWWGTYCAAVTQALAWANDLPVVPISTLQALAQAAYRVSLCKWLQSRMRVWMKSILRVFSWINQGIMQAVDTEQLLNYSAASQAVRFRLVGSGSALIQPEAMNLKRLLPQHKILHKLHVLLHYSSIGLQLKKHYQCIYVIMRGKNSRTN